MIVFDLVCANEHRFEGWFDDLAALEDQVDRGLVSCPVCGASQVSRIPSTFGIRSGAATSAANENGPSPELFRAFVKKFGEYVRDNFENVGSRFATEALKMHYGVKEHRNIRGSSTPAEEKMLADEGVEFTKIPLPAVPPDDAE